LLNHKGDFRQPDLTVFFSSTTIFKIVGIYWTNLFVFSDLGDIGNSYVANGKFSFMVKFCPSKPGVQNKGIHMIPFLSL
jgi:hypothetical protein